jgi:hypothetical protein
MPRQRDPAHHIVNVLVGIPGDEFNASALLAIQKLGWTVRSFEVQQLIGYDKNKPREQVDPRVKGAKAEHNRNKREQLAEQALEFLASHRGSTLYITDIVKHVGQETMDYNLKMVMTQLLEQKKIRRTKAGPGGGPKAYLYSIAAATKKKPKRNYKAEREAAKRKKAAEQSSDQPAKPEGQAA